jgi:alpha-amylase
MNTNSDIYKMTAAINKARKSTQSYDHPQEEKYVTDNFYAFARGQMFVALTNNHNSVSQTVPNAPWANGTTVCNIFYPDSDCQTIQNGSINVSLQNGESKIYVPKSNSFFSE